MNRGKHSQLTKKQRKIYDRFIADGFVPVEHWDAKHDGAFFLLPKNRVLKLSGPNAVTECKITLVDITGDANIVETSCEVGKHVNGRVRVDVTARISSTHQDYADITRD